jgi:hypothetical protein
VICQPCKERLHDRCRGGTWCDCQHRFNPLVVEIPPGLTLEQRQAMLDELTVLAQEDRLGDHGSDL